MNKIDVVWFIMIHDPKLEKWPHFSLKGATIHEDSKLSSQTQYRVWSLFTPMQERLLGDACRVLFHILTDACPNSTHTNAVSFCLRCVQWATDLEISWPSKKIHIRLPQSVTTRAIFDPSLYYNACFGCIKGITWLYDESNADEFHLYKLFSHMRYTVSTPSPIHHTDCLDSNQSLCTGMSKRFHNRHVLITWNARLSDKVFISTWYYAGK